MKKSILYLVSVILLTSCSIQKRHYRSGYSLVWNKNSKEISYHAKTTRQIVKSTENGVSNYKENNGKVALDLASVNNTPVIEIKKPLVYSANQIDAECDVITLKNGDEIKAKIIEITQTEIKYKKCEFLTGPLISIDKAEVFMIKYSNGSKDIIKAPEKINAVDKVTPVVTNETPKTHGLAIASMILGILSLITSLVYLYAVIAFAVLAIIFGAVAFSKINGAPTKYKGKGMAAAGIFCGILALFLFTVLYLMLVGIIR